MENKRANSATLDYNYYFLHLKGLFTWGWGTPGRLGNPLRWGYPPVHIISRFNFITFT